MKNIIEDHNNIIKILNYQGLIALRYDFIDVTLNGKHFGVYAIEENFRKNLIENNISIHIIQR